MSSTADLGDFLRGGGGVNHIAIVVRDVGRSLQFYSGVLGLEQLRRPDFYRSV